MSTTKEPHFKTIQSLQLSYAPIKITQYESSKTGMRIAVIDQPGPKVQGYFALATEIHDDSGAPHTLEHLCFMGSKSYHYKGLLDKLATRFYSMTNAWTATETTTYTLDTAGWAAFSIILPVYLDHLVVPTLTDAGCYTEVHHVNGEGEDAGVVYSEMQGTQNDSSELMDLALRRAMYPEGNGFRYETGGMMEALRVLTAERIRGYHREMYQPKNLRLVVTGEVDHEELLRIVEKFEGSILDDIPSRDAPFKRPWTESEPTPPLKESRVLKVPFPEEDESSGEILIGYHGPHYEDYISSSALAVLIQYLCGSSISVLENTLVEREQLCSAVYIDFTDRTDSSISVYMTSVETSQLEAVERRFVELLKEVAARELDMGYLQDCITRIRRQVVAKAENAGSFFSDLVIEDHLYGRRSGEDLKHLENLEDFDTVAKWTESQWRELLRKWLSNAEHISILGIPSKEMSARLTAEEKARVKAQQEALGEAGLKEKAEALKKAQEENDRPIPEALLESFVVPGAESIHFIPTTTARSGAARKLGPKLDNEIQKVVDADIDGDGGAEPLFIHFEHIPSNFVRITIDMCTASLPVELKPLISLYLMNFFTTPVMKGTKRVEFEDVVLDLERETVYYSISNERANGDMLCLAIEVEREKYGVIIAWLRIMIFDAVHDATRLYASLTKILADVPDEKREASSMVSAVLLMVQQGQGSTVRAQSTLSKSLYLRRMRKMLKDDESGVLAKFGELCKTLHRAENFRIFVAADISKLSKPVTAWKSFTANLDLSNPLQPIDNRKQHLTPLGQNPGNSMFVVPMAATDSSYAVLSTKGPDAYSHPDVAALKVASAYLDAVEGPLWVSVRGTGLAYGTYWRTSLDTGIVTFTIYRSPDAFKAWKAAKEQVEGYASGEFKFDRFALEGAISEIVLGMANEQPSMAAAAEASYGNQVIRGVGKDYNKGLLERVRAVTPEEIRAVMGRYMVPAFKAGTSNVAVTCAQIMEEEMVRKFKEAGFEPKVRSLESFQDDYGLEAPGGEGDEADEDEEEDDEDDGDEDDDDEDEDDDDDDDEPMDTPPGSSEDA